MGNQKFKLSDMIPNAWFYKLKNMTKPPKSHSLTSAAVTTKLKKHRLPPPPAPPSSPPSSTTKTTSPPPPPPNPEHQCQPRKSYHFTRDLPLPPPEDPPLSPPRKSKSSSKSRKPTGKIRTTAFAKKQPQLSPSSSVSGQDTATLRSHRPKSQEADDNFPPNLENAPPKTAEHFDIVIGVDDCNYKYRVPGSAQLLASLSNKFNGFDFQLPRIITKPKQSTQEEKPIALAPARRLSVSSPAGIRLKINSPRIMGRKLQGQNGNNGGGRRSVKKRRSISESFAVVKSSEDPQRDFRESMVEMIVQNNLRASKDLEDLLACYLSLNSDEYHDVIIKVFKQIWFDLSGFSHQKLVP